MKRWNGPGQCSMVEEPHAADAAAGEPAERCWCGAAAVGTLVITPENGSRAVSASCAGCARSLTAAHQRNGGSARFTMWGA